MMGNIEEKLSNPINQWVTFRLGEESYGIVVMQVQEVLRIPDITPVPGSPDYVIGIINLRGNVVTTKINDADYIIRSTHKPRPTRTSPSDPQCGPATSEQLSPHPIVQTLTNPQLTEGKFRALSFRVGKLLLTTHLGALARTVNSIGDTQVQAEQPSWVLATLEDQGDRIMLLNTMALLAPRNHRSSTQLSQLADKKILVSKDLHWGWLCDEIVGDDILDQESVRWRRNRATRPWLIGTVLSRNSALIELNSLIPPLF